ncbi:hypothetical protein [Amycolatopsis sp. BJA-103]|uniref:hypothetical protein n=1 Tax=Amycolatopsis sp. BJA-103 TaxID=1911175 RepID=UPI000C76C55D|nr:hypothetical protein [Amycolatopsis sp. BJA-103]PNE17560.1 hypothetical protein B1H26_21825 [Amycolatopsis sp. BJA-103]
MTPLDDAIAIAVQGDFPSGASEIDGHDFYVRSVRNKGLLDEGETSYFRHEHIGKDDRVFYSIDLRDSGEYSARITRIQFRGPFVKNGFRPLGDRGIDVTDAVKVLAAAGGVISNLPGAWIVFAVAIAELDAQGFLDGNWMPAAAKVVDKIGKEMARTQTPG